MPAVALVPFVKYGLSHRGRANNLQSTLRQPFDVNVHKRAYLHLEISETLWPCVKNLSKKIVIPAHVIEFLISYLSTGWFQTPMSFLTPTLKLLASEISSVLILRNVSVV